MQWRLREEKVQLPLTLLCEIPMKGGNLILRKLLKWDFIALSNVKAMKFNRCRELLPDISKIYDKHLPMDMEAMSM